MCLPFTCTERALRAVLAAAAFALGLGLAAGGVSAQTVEALVMPGDVIEGHARFELECKQCHKPFDKDAQPRLCLDCHEDVSEDITQAKGFHGRQDALACRECHTDHAGRDADIIGLDPDHFDHALTDFVLRGKHEDTQCTACHVPERKFREAQGECIACHREDDAHEGRLGEQCASCHQESTWADTDFDHDRDTDYPLTGLHREVKCELCHVDPIHAGPTPTTCNACHATDDVHAGTLGPRCDTCHGTAAWTQTHFDHARDTSFPLDGGHEAVECTACHADMTFKETAPTACGSCHLDDDVHEGKLGGACERCHDETRWAASRFDHDEHTRQPLRGKHAGVECKLCHADLTFREKTPTRCYECHRDDDQARGHRGRFGKRCETCHVESSWRKSKFNHARATGFRLRGAHRKARCASCHTGSLYGEPLPVDCHACHRDDDVHEGQLGTRCDACHVESAWSRVTFNHDDTRFPLRGRHVEVKCTECHDSVRFSDTSSQCVACHRDDDEHRGRLGPRCDRCHSPSSWKDWTFDHDRDTDFRLDGAHARVKCVRCHVEEVIGKVLMGETCVDCHARDDVHFGSLTKACGRCHGSQSWRDVSEVARSWAKQGGPPPP